MDTNYHDTYFVNEGECVAVATLRWTWHATLLWCSAMLGTVEVSRMLPLVKYLVQLDTALRWSR